MYVQLLRLIQNRPFARSGQMVQSHTCCDARCGRFKTKWDIQNKVGHSKLSGTFKTKGGQRGLVRVALFWNPRWAAWVPVCVISHHVTASCKLNHDRNGIWKPDQIRIILFLLFYFSFFSLVVVSIEEMYQALTTLFDHVPNFSRFTRNIPLRAVFSTLFSVFGNVIKHGLLRFIYCLQHQFCHTLN